MKSPNKESSIFLSWDQFASKTPDFSLTNAQCGILPICSSRPIPTGDGRCDLGAVCAVGIPSDAGVGCGKANNGLHAHLGQVGKNQVTPLSVGRTLLSVCSRTYQQNSFVRRFPRSVRRKTTCENRQSKLCSKTPVAEIRLTCAPSPPFLVHWSVGMVGDGPSKTGEAPGHRSFMFFVAIVATETTAAESSTKK